MPINESMQDTQDATRTFRGRSIEAVIPQIRAELGADAIVLRSRERLEGGIAGFFQRQVIEVEARAPLAHEIDADHPVRNDRATREGLATPALKALVEQAQPFATELAVAQQTAAERADELLARAAIAGGPEFEAIPVVSGLYGPQGNVVEAPASDPARGRVRAKASVAVPGALSSVAAADALPLVIPADALEPELARPRDAAAAIERRLVASGMTEAFAADVVGEAVDHHLPFGDLRSTLEDHVRTALAGRFDVMRDLGPGRRTLAIAGAAGAGKTAFAANLAVAYAAAGRRVGVIALAPADGGRALTSRLEPLGLHVHVVADAEEARDRLTRLRPLLAVVDTPAVAHGDMRAAVALAKDIRLLRADEVHVALPATLSRQAAGEAAHAFAALGDASAVLTHVDATRHPGAVLEELVETRRPVSYVCGRSHVRPADAADLARRLLP